MAISKSQKIQKITTGQTDRKLNTVNLKTRDRMADVAKRPRREAAKNKIYTDATVLKCNPANFVGYVEDLETPEMISTFQDTRY